jgi:hypothetical protein
MIICYDHFMLVQFAHVRIRQNTTLWNYLLLAGQRRTSGTLYKGALRMWLRLSVCNRQGLAASAFLFALIHRSAWNRNSANFGLTEFYEVRQVRCNNYCN